MMVDERAEEDEIRFGNGLRIGGGPLPDLEIIEIERTLLRAHEGFLKRSRHHCGRPRMFLAMILRWIWLLPP